MAPLDRLLGWTVPAVSTGGMPQNLRGLTLNDWDTLDAGQWLPRALRCWSTGVFEPAERDASLSPLQAASLDALLRGLTWLACVQKALDDHPLITGIELERPRRTSPSTRPEALDDEPVGSVPKVTFWRNVPVLNGALWTGDLPPLPRVDEVFAGYAPALADESRAVQGALNPLLNQLSGVAERTPLNRGNVALRAARLMGPTLALAVRIRCEQQLLAEAASTPRTGPDPVLPERPRERL